MNFIYIYKINMLECLKQFFCKKKIFNEYNFIDSKEKINKNEEKKFMILNNEIYVECIVCFNLLILKNIKMLYPCGHRLCCDNCLNNIDICILCKKPIEKKIKIYEII